MDRTVDEIMRELGKLPHDLLWGIAHAIGLNLNPCATKAKVLMEVSCAIKKGKP